MAKNGFKVMDSDMHVIEPKDLWQRYTDPAFKNRAPQCFDRYYGDMQVLVDGILQPTDPPKVADSANDERNYNEIYKDSYTNNWDSASQVRAMDKEGIDVAFLYPSRGLFTLARDAMDPELGASIARAYNDWMRDFCSIDPARMWGAAMISAFDVESAVAEVRRSVEELGHRAVFLRPNVVNGRNWHDPYYDPLWREIEALGVALGFHEGSNSGMSQVGDRFADYTLFHICCHPMEMMLSVVDTIGGGVFERFPKLRVGFLEGNCSWLPWLIWRMDEHFEYTGQHEYPDLKLKPMEYFLRQGFVSIEADEGPARFLPECGLEETVVFSTDYPHNDSRYPHAIDTLLAQSLPKRLKRKILWDNCARLYGFN